MCRITGFWDYNYKGNYSLDEVVTRMRDTLTYGGPDDAGNYCEEERGLAFGHRRLSIIDLSPMGHQPMSNENKTVWIDYNGEIYNFHEVREELERYGFHFHSNCDTEVIIKAYEKWGMDCVHRFRGMWAFAIWDKNREELILCRDRAGVKPLYWYYKDGLFIFASELKAFHQHPDFHKELDLESLSLFLQFGYITAPHCIFQNSYKLSPGHFLVLNKKGDIKVIKYWDIEDSFIKGAELERTGYFKYKTDEEIAEELEDIMIKSFKLRLVADVPVGIFLSGGLDSSLVTALLQKESTLPLKTFTIGFYEEKFNEAQWAKKIAGHLGTEHTELYCTPKEAYEIIPRLPELYDEPFGDSSALPTHLVSKLAKTKVKVSLSADGGDEQFCGYVRYWVLADTLNKIPGKVLGKLFLIMFGRMQPDRAEALYEFFKPVLPRWHNFREKFIKTREVVKYKGLTQRYVMANTYFPPEEVRELGLVTGKKFPVDETAHLKYGDKNSLMLLDYKTYMADDILTKVDRATMSVSLEGREPLLDNRLSEYLAALPLHYKFRNGTSKFILRKILYKYVPEHFLVRPKQGFGLPIDHWFKKELKELLYPEYLGEKRIKKTGVLNPKYVKRICDNYFNERAINSTKLWHLLMFQMWHERWMSA